MTFRSELPGLVTERDSDDFMMRSLRSGQVDPVHCELGLVEDQPLEWARLDYHAEVMNIIRCADIQRSFCLSFEIIVGDFAC